MLVADGCGWAAPDVDPAPDVDRAPALVVLADGQPLGDGAELVPVTGGHVDDGLGVLVGRGDVGRGLEVGLGALELGRGPVDVGRGALLVGPGAVDVGRGSDGVVDGRVDLGWGSRSGFGSFVEDVRLGVGDVFGPVVESSDSSATSLEAFGT